MRAKIADFSDVTGHAAGFTLSVRSVMCDRDMLEREWEMPLQATSGSMQLHTGDYDENGQLATGTMRVDLAERLEVSYAAPLRAAWLITGMERRRSRPESSTDGSNWMYSVSLS